MTDQNWTSWDRSLSILNIIESQSRWIEYHAGQLEQALRLLPSQIDSEARATVRLQEAIDRLDTARALCKAALARQPLTLQAAE